MMQECDKQLNEVDTSEKVEETEKQIQYNIRGVLYYLFHYFTLLDAFHTFPLSH